MRGVQDAQMQGPRPVDRQLHDLRNTDAGMFQAEGDSLRKI
jgi:hypothetical protein